MNARTLTVPYPIPSGLQILETGLHQEGIEIFHALPRELVSSFLIFELIPQHQMRKVPFLVKWLTAIRAFSLTATLTPCLCVALYGGQRGWTSNTEVAISALLGVAFLQVAVNVLNDVEDHFRLIDLPSQNGGSGVIQKGWVSAREMRRLGHASLVLGCLLGVPALILHPIIILAIGAVAALGVLGYSGRPLGLKYRALGDLAVLAFCGPLLTYGFAIADFGRVDTAVGVIGIFFGLAACAILHANNLQDILIDQARGAVTLASSIGFRKSKQLFALIYLGAYLALALGAAATFLPIIAVIPTLGALPAIVKTILKVFKASGPESAILTLIRVEAAQLHLLMGATLAVGLIAARWNPWR